MQIIKEEYCEDELQENYSIEQNKMADMQSKDSIEVTMNKHREHEGTNIESHVSPQNRYI